MARKRVKPRTYWRGGSIAASMLGAGEAVVIGEESPAFDGDTIVASSASYAHVSAAVASASDGDIVEIPAGSASWSSTLVIDKAIWLKGAGTSSTTGTRLSGSAAPLVAIEGVPENRGYTKASGIRFTSHSGDFPVGAYLDIWAEPGTINIRCTDMYFTGTTGWAIAVWSAGYGNNTGVLLDHITYRDVFLIKAHSDNFEAWKQPLNLGSGAYLYIEDLETDHTTQYGSGTGWVIVDGFQGARVVLRHSKIVGGYFGTHDTARAGEFSASARAWEIYENEISNLSSAGQLWKGIDIGSGSGVVFNNTFTGNIAHPLGLYDYKTYDDRGIGACDGSNPEDGNTSGQSGWLCQFQVGVAYESVPGTLPERDPTWNDPWHKGNWGQYAVSDPAYFWGNTYNGSPVTPTDTGGDRLQAGRDYINGTRSGYTPYPYPHPLQSI